MASLAEEIETLPANIQRELRQYVYYLVQVKGRAKDRHLKLSWAGGLRDLRDQYTSHQLKKKALEWRTEDIMKHINQ